MNTEKSTATKYPNRPWIKWYSTAAWRKLRLQALKREPLCRFCKKMGIITAGDTVDHIDRHSGDMAKFFNPYNLQVLCKTCHSSAKQRMEKSGNFGCDENGIVESWK